MKYFFELDELEVVVYVGRGDVNLNVNVDPEPEDDPGSGHPVVTTLAMLCESQTLATV